MSLKQNNNASFSSTDINHVLTFTGNTNPCTFTFNEVYNQVSKIELLDCRFERSEFTCEDYRNTGFIILTNDYSNLVTFNDEKVALFNREIGADINTFIDLLLNTPRTTSEIPISRNFLYTYTPSVSLTAPLYKCCPYVLNIQDYTISNLVNTLNNINSEYVDNTSIQAVSVTTHYDLETEKLYFTSNKLFYLFPSNAFRVIGLRPDVFYKSVYDDNTGEYVIYANFKPKLDGPDVIYIQNPESLIMFRNQEYVTLATVYLTNSEYTSLYSKHNVIIDREFHVINKMNKITFSLYSDTENKFLYHTNGLPWTIQIYLKGYI